ncbi:hypothetical protein P692DRAFT_20820483 [Suillus brevipes Sb2]|nr:hypothetical protein P692DRAFT_20820483 [Suillus brevipes Sb2]
MELLPRNIAKANVSYRSKPKTQRGLHGASKQFEKLQNYIGSRMREDRLDWINTVHEVEKIKIYSDAFVHTTKNKKHTECAMKNQYPNSFNANKLKHPPFLAAQFCNSIMERGQKALVITWEVLEHYTSRSEANQSSTPAYHFGIWQMQQNQPKITRATRK